MLTRRPCPPLDVLVESLWFNERSPLPHARERNLPTGCADIVIPLLQDALTRFSGVDDLQGHRYRSGIVQGAHDRVQLRGTDGPSRVVGVHFRPGGAAALLGAPLRELHNHTIGLDELWGPSAWRLQAWLQEAGSPAACLDRLETHLLARLQSPPQIDPVVSFALARFARHPSDARVDDIRQASGCSAARFIQRFESAVGLTPKRYARILRFQALLSQLAATPAQTAGRPWAELAGEAGYSDQSHLIHEFKRLTGITPAAYRPVMPGQPSHVAIDMAPWPKKSPIQRLEARLG